jgi:hypothetical protein
LRVGCRQTLPYRITEGLPVIEDLNPGPLLACTLRLFPVEGINILGPGVAKHNRRIVGGDRKPTPVKAHGDKILEVHNPFRSTKTSYH